MQIFPNFALAILTTIEPIFPLFQRSLMASGTPKVDHEKFVILGSCISVPISHDKCDITQYPGITDYARSTSGVPFPTGVR